MNLTIGEKYILIREKLYRLASHAETEGDREGYTTWAGGPICDELERILEIARTLDGDD